MRRNIIQFSQKEKMIVFEVDEEFLAFPTLDPPVFGSS